MTITTKNNDDNQTTIQENKLISRNWNCNTDFLLLDFKSDSKYPFLYLNKYEIPISAYSKVEFDEIDLKTEKSLVDTFLLKDNINFKRYNLSYYKYLSSKKLDINFKSNNSITYYVIVVDEVLAKINDRFSKTVLFIEVKNESILSNIKYLDIESHNNILKEIIKNVKNTI